MCNAISGQDKVIGSVFTCVSIIVAAGITMLVIGILGHYGMIAMTPIGSRALTVLGSTAIISLVFLLYCPRQGIPRFC